VGQCGRSARADTPTPSPSRKREGSYNHPIRRNRTNSSAQITAIAPSTMK